MFVFCVFCVEISKDLMDDEGFSSKTSEEQRKVERCKKWGPPFHSISLSYSPFACCCCCCCYVDCHVRDGLSGPAFSLDIARSLFVVVIFGCC